MQTKLPKAAASALQFEEKKLENGLVLRVLPMPHMSAVHTIYATGFGAIHRAFVTGGKRVDLPAGVAHFLEHKMFENKDGVDAFTLYAETGAQANAYTGFDRTSYIFTATSRVDENLDILLGFVNEPYFTEASVHKEQGIIGQEIMANDDRAEIKALFALFECLYHSHPIRDEILGTIDTIAEITPEMLYSCTDAFYSPSSMALCAAGNITMAQLEAAVRRAGLDKKPAVDVQRLMPEEAPGVAEKHREFEMAVSMPILHVGFKETPPVGNTTKTEVVCDMLTELLCGETSPLYHTLYDEGLVQPGFGAEYGCFENCLYFAVGGESNQPEKVRTMVLAEIERLRREGVDEAQFETCKKMMYGASIADLDSVERVASLLSASYFRGRTPAEELDAIASLAKADVDEALQHMLQEERSATVVVRPLAE